MNSLGAMIQQEHGGEPNGELNGNGNEAGDRRNGRPGSSTGNDRRSGNRSGNRTAGDRRPAMDRAVGTFADRFREAAHIQTGAYTRYLGTVQGGRRGR